MQPIVTSGIVMHRTNYGEADRIITYLTDTHGKIKAIAKGVRKSRSKLAGGVELLSVSELTFIRGRGELYTLISARLITFYNNIVKDLERVQLAYELLKTVNRLIEVSTGQEFYSLMIDTLQALNNPNISVMVSEMWFWLHLLKQLGNQPNLTKDKTGAVLQVAGNYGFDLESMSFFASPIGSFTAAHIKLLRLNLVRPPAALQQVKGVSDILPEAYSLVKAIHQQIIQL